jgi:lysyl-tRNA synthetase class 2
MRRNYQFKLIQLIRKYFIEQDFLEVLTPPAVQNPGMEVHIHPFQLTSAVKRSTLPLYLHTSPEFCMKELLADSKEELDRIYQISYCFRDEPESPIHRPQFLMLEWYRKNQRYEALFQDVQNLISFVIEQGQKTGMPLRQEFRNVTFVRKTMAELFKEEANIDILKHLEIDSIKNLAKTLPEVPLPSADLEWDDYFFLIYLNLIEPKLKKYPFLLVYEFPSPLSALSTIKESDPRVCERFEVYLNGIELCNAFNELTHAKELKERFKSQNQLKQKLYGYALPEPKQFYSVMDKGYPASAGIALGVERLLTTLFEVENPFYY